MKIGIDIDDVITDTSKIIKEYIIKNGKEEEFSDYMEEIIKGETPTKEIKKFMNENLNEMLRKSEIKENCIKVINEIKNKGHEIYLITARGNLMCPNIEEETIENLKEIKYEKAFFNIHGKGKVCKENEIDIMIDDSIKNLKEVEKEGIKTILFETEVNKKNIEFNNFEKVSNWMELLEKIK